MLEILTLYKAFFQYAAMILKFLTSFNMHDLNSNTATGCVMALKQTELQTVSFYYIRQ